MQPDIVFLRSKIGRRGMPTSREITAARLAILVSSLCVVTCILGVEPALSQNYRILYEFAGGADGGQPEGLTLGRTGELFGVAHAGGKPGKDCEGGCGTIFRMSRSGRGWRLSVLHTFQDVPDGAAPAAPMTPGPDGALYGTTIGGGLVGPPEPEAMPSFFPCHHSGCGTVFRLTPPVVPCEPRDCSWSEAIIHRFTGEADGSWPNYDAPLLFDQQGNLYGTTQYGGSDTGTCRQNEGCGVVFELSPSPVGWSEKVLHAFTAGTDGAWPGAGVVFDKSGNLYGTTTWTGFQLTPDGSQWKFHLIFQTGSSTIYGPGLTLDPFGNLYGGTEDGGTMGGGNVFKIVPDGAESWDVQSIYSFVPGGGRGNYYPGPSASMIMDSAGNLYGVTEGDGAYGMGSAFELSPSGGGDPWSYTFTDLHDFSGFDGSAPVARLVMDREGNLYGTTQFGGNPSCNCGVVFVIEGAAQMQGTN